MTLDLDDARTLLRRTPSVLGSLLRGLPDAWVHENEGPGTWVRGLRLRDHTVSQSMYLNDPDGNQLELYVDADPDIWRNDPSAVATSIPLEL